MFNPDFYPTPPDVAALILDPLDLRSKTVLEPSAGKGDLVRECLNRGAGEVLWCEKEPELAQILAGITGATPTHAYSDFLELQASDVSHIDLIAMNPPFSADEAHILHAWEIAPPGCEIVALCNWNTCEGTYRRLQLQLSNLIESYGSKENLGECFATAERSTRVSVGMVRLTKPGLRANAADNVPKDDFLWALDRPTTVAALRAVADAVVPEPPDCGQALHDYNKGAEDRQKLIRFRLLAIIAELEGSNND